jgi:hypothetical protein
MLRSRLALGLLLALGLTLRFVLAWYRSEDLLSDNDGYLAHAKPVAAGAGFHGPYTDCPTAFRPPAYPVILGGLIAFGFSDAMAVGIVSFVSSVVIFLLTRTLALQAGMDQRWSLLAVLAVVLDPLLLRYSILPMTEVPCAAILLAAVVAFPRFRSGGVVGDQSSMWPEILSGVLFGIGTLIRPVVMIVCVFVTLYALWCDLRARRSAVVCSTNSPPVAVVSARDLSGLVSLFIPAIVAGFVICPWVVRNAVQFHHFIPATTHGGYTLALGNNPDFYRDVINGADEFPWDGAGLDAWQKRMIRESESQGILATNEPAADAWYYSQAMAAIRAEPASFLKASALRLRRFWATATADSSAGSGLSRSLVMVWYGMLWIGLILQIAWACFGKRSPQHCLMVMLWLVILAFLVMHSVYWTDTRMRAPLMPIMIVISVSGWQSASTCLAGRVFKC